MNAKACASSHREVDWHSIDWAKCYQTVRRLQARIVKATQEGRYNKVKALQWTLTHSFSAKALAVRRVTENQGKNTPGVDGATWSTPAAKSQAIMSLRRHGYKPSPLRRVYIPKANGKKMRGLSIPVYLSYCTSFQRNWEWCALSDSGNSVYSPVAQVDIEARRGLRCLTGLRKVAISSGVRAIQRGPCGIL